MLTNCDIRSSEFKPQSEAGQRNLYKTFFCDLNLSCLSSPRLLLVLPHWPLVPLAAFAPPAALPLLSPPSLSPDLLNLT